MATVSLGNVAPIAKLTVPETGERVIVPQTQLKQSITTINIPDHIGFDEALHLVKNGFWPAMSSEKPAWVESDDPELEGAIARSLDCPRGRPDDYEVETSGAPGPATGFPMEAAAQALASGAGYLESAPVAVEEPAPAPEPAADAAPTEV